MTDKQRTKAARKKFKKPAGKFSEIDLTKKPNKPKWMTRAFSNNRYVVMIDDKAKMTHGVTAISALIQRHDNKPITNHWKTIQAIKNELFGPETTGIEYYPAQSNLIDDFNIYWLWVLPENQLPIYIKGTKS